MGSPAARAALALAVVASIAACSGADPAGDGGATTPGATSSRPAPASGTVAQTLPEILDFSAPRLGGGTIEGADYRGQDLALWFWAPW